METMTNEKFLDDISRILSQAAPSVGGIKKHSLASSIRSYATAYEHCEGKTTIAQQQFLAELAAAFDSAE